MRTNKETYIAVQSIYYPSFTIGGLREGVGMLAALGLLLMTLLSRSFRCDLCFDRRFRRIPNGSVRFLGNEPAASCRDYVRLGRKRRRTNLLARSTDGARQPAPDPSALRAGRCHDLACVCDGRYISV